MTTQTTPNLGLIKPVPGTGELMSAWPAQNDSNLDSLDRAYGVETGTWVPVLTGSVTNPTFGSGGFITGSFVRFWNNWITLWLRLNFGTTSFNAGSGTYSVAFPAAYPLHSTAYGIKATSSVRKIVVGKGAYLDANASLNSTVAGVTLEAEGDKVTFRLDPGSSVWSAATPVAMQTSDSMRASWSYLSEPV